MFLAVPILKHFRIGLIFLTKGKDKSLSEIVLMRAHIIIIILFCLRNVEKYTYKDDDNIVMKFIPG